MRHLLTVTLLVVLAACDGQRGERGPAGPRGEQGDPGPAGTQGMPGLGADGGSTPATVCVPNQPFCEGNTLWTCTKSGRDAVFGAECTGTVTNPATCKSTGCAGGRSACCVPQTPPCSVSITTATTADGGTYPTTGYSCTPPAASCPNLGTFSAHAIPPSAPTACTTAPEPGTIYVLVPRPVAVGQPISLPATGVTLYLVNAEAPRQCLAWTGTVTVDAEVPDWSVSVNATCSEAGKSAIRLVATIAGAL